MSRPLKTGRSFVLVVPALPRVVNLSWDKAFYDPGDEAELVVVGRTLGSEPLRIEIQREGPEEGSCVAIAVLETTPDGSGSEARARWRFPAPGDGSFAQGRFTKAEWDLREVDAGETLGLHVTADGLEGAEIAVAVERELPDGSWEIAATWQARIEDHKYDSRWQVAP